jgi:hypothetical protein
VLSYVTIQYEPQQLFSVRWYKLMTVFGKLKDFRGSGHIHQKELRKVKYHDSCASAKIWHEQLNTRQRHYFLTHLAQFVVYYYVCIGKQVKYGRLPSLFLSNCAVVTYQFKNLAAKQRIQMLTQLCNWETMYLSLFTLHLNNANIILLIIDIILI